MTAASALLVANGTAPPADKWLGVEPAVREVCELISGEYLVFPSGEVCEVCGKCRFEPTVAELILSTRNQHNRREIRNNTLFLSRILREGLWKVTGETVIFDWHGQLRNGRHRLGGVVHSGKPLETFVILGVDPDAFDVMDQGVKRVAGHVLTIQGEKNPNQLAGAISILQHFRDTGTLHDRAVIKEGIQGHEALLEWHPTIRESVNICSSKEYRCFPSPSIISALHYLFGAVSPELRDELFRGMVTMTMSEEDRWNAPKYLIRYVTGSARKSLDQHKAIYGAMLIKAWNYFLKGAGPKEIRWREGEAYPQISGWAYTKDGLPLSAGSIRFPRVEEPAKGTGASPKPLSAF